ncbi:MAG: cobyric acid synthase [Candidatus Omnitrophica bacterium]|nr:cobyric acid synthase [Candidatus Omnitrophota bacterium]
MVPDFKTLMFQGTASHVGKSVLTMAFCRLLKRRGIRVAPFKGMNMSNNAWVTRDGGEIAAAQAAQARACGLEPTVEMNPVLLKTMSDQTCQVIVHGKPLGIFHATEMRSIRGRLAEAVQGGLRKVMASHDFVVIEGAGSPAEVNLQETDLANMLVARAADAPVVLVADIERGGVFAQIVGTLELLRPEDRERVRGFIINKFRGDPSLLDSGVQWLEERTGRPVLGVLPHFQDLGVPEEDALAECLQKSHTGTGYQTVPGTDLRIEVIRYPTISNFTDFEPFQREPGVRVEYLAAPEESTAAPALVILPGSKSTMADLVWLRERGFDRYLARRLDEGVEVLGVCGGFQMLGRTIYDPGHVESQAASMEGLGYLPTDTLFLASKVTAQVRGVHLESGERVTGYEIHCGRLQGARRGRPVFRLTERAGVSVDAMDGCLHPDLPLWGTYLHGLFDEPGYRRAFLARLRREAGLAEPAPTPQADPFDDLADRVEPHLHWNKLKPAPSQEAVKT